MAKLTTVSEATPVSPVPDWHPLISASPLGTDNECVLSGACPRGTERTRMSLGPLEKGEEEGEEKEEEEEET